MKRAEYGKKNTESMERGEKTVDLLRALILHIGLPDGRFLQEGQVNPKECHVLVFFRPWSVHVLQSALLFS